MKATYMRLRAAALTDTLSRFVEDVRVELARSESPLKKLPMEAEMLIHSAAYCLQDLAVLAAGLKGGTK